MTSKRLQGKRAFQYMKKPLYGHIPPKPPFSGHIEKYIPDGKRQDEPGNPISQQETTDGQQEYFSMKLLSLIHEVCVGEQFEEISALDFYANMNLQPCNCKLRIKPREKIRVCYLIFLMGEKLSKQDKTNGRPEYWNCWILTTATTNPNTRSRFLIFQVTATRNSPRKWNIYSDNP